MDSNQPSFNNPSAAGPSPQQTFNPTQDTASTNSTPFSAETSQQFPTTPLSNIANNQHPNTSRKSVIKICLFIGAAIVIALMAINLIYAITCDSAVEESSGFSDRNISYKPVIYLYPLSETNISVKLLRDQDIIYSYPRYANEWNVSAHPNGQLVDLETGRNLYSLYYESKNKVNFGIHEDGFIVKSDNVATFLEEKLAILGLTEIEAEEFIIYWMPKLESNPYNYVRFATIEEINENMPLEINPNPDTIIRILMTYKGIDMPFEVEQQELETPKRAGFTVVEWGGAEIE